MEKQIILGISILAILILAACQAQTQGASSSQSSEPKTTDTGKTRIATIETDKGTIKIELYEGKVPISVKNFIDLAESGFYNGLIFHRVEPHFVVQTGDPKGDGTGGSGKTIPLEIVQGLTHEKGAVGMARRQDPNSATSQFYIALSDIHSLDGQYAVFGKVTEGMEVVEKIEVGDKMNKVTIQ